MSDGGGTIRYGGGEFDRYRCRDCGVYGGKDQIDWRRNADTPDQEVPGVVVAVVGYGRRVGVRWAQAIEAWIDTFGSVQLPGV